MIQIRSRHNGTPLNYSLSCDAHSKDPWRFIIGELVELYFVISEYQVAVLRSLDHTDYTVYTNLEERHTDKTGVVFIPFRVVEVIHRLDVDQVRHSVSSNEPSYEIQAETGLWEDYFVWLVDLGMAEWIENICEDIKQHPQLYCLDQTASGDDTQVYS